MDYKFVNTLLGQDIQGVCQTFMKSVKLGSPANTSFPLNNVYTYQINLSSTNQAGYVFNLVADVCGGDLTKVNYLDIDILSESDDQFQNTISTFQFTIDGSVNFTGSHFNLCNISGIPSGMSISNVNVPTGYTATLKIVIGTK